MPTYDQWKTYDKDAEAAGLVADRCSDYVVAEVKSLPATIDPWRESDDPPGEDTSPLDQYRYFLFEQEREDSPENRKHFREVLYDWEMDKWERGTSVEWD